MSDTQPDEEVEEERPPDGPPPDDRPYTLGTDGPIFLDEVVVVLDPPSAVPGGPEEGPPNDEPQT